MTDFITLFWDIIMGIDNSWVGEFIAPNGRLVTHDVPWIMFILVTGFIWFMFLLAMLEELIPKKKKSNLFSLSMALIFIITLPITHILGIAALFHLTINWVSEAFKELKS